MPAEKTLLPNLSCGNLTDELVSTDEAMFSLPTRVHVAECFRCQTELHSYRQVRAMMRALGNEPVDPLPTLENEIRDLLDKCDNTSIRRIQTGAVATVGGIVAAAGVLALAKRQRRIARFAI